MDNDHRVHRNLELGGLLDTLKKPNATAVLQLQPKILLEAFVIVSRHIDCYCPSRNTQWVLNSLQRNRGVIHSLTVAASNGDYSEVRKRECTAVFSSSLVSFMHHNLRLIFLKTTTW